MTKLTTRSLSAATAIAAVLALGSTPGMAQDATNTDPVQIAAPPVTVTPAPSTETTTTAPVITLPDVTASPAVEPVATPESTSVSSAPTPAPSASASTTTSRPAPVSTRTTSAPSSSITSRSTAVAPLAAPAPVASAPAATSDTALPEVGTDLSQPIQPMPAAAPAANPAPTQDQNFPTGALVGLLAVLGIGAAGWAAMRSRRRRDAVLADEPVAAPLVERGRAPQPVRRERLEPAVPVTGAPMEPAAARIEHPGRDAAIATAGAAAGASVLAARHERKEERREERETAREDLREDAATNEAVREDVAARRDTAATPVAMPEGEVPHGAEREALLDRMVAASPDSTNPFTSRKARRRRARLILQHREHLQQEGKPFDWRTYRPSTKPSPVTPSKVEA